MLEQIDDARDAPGRFDEVRREQSGDGHVEVREGAPHEDERQHEVGGGDTDVVDQRERVVDRGAWMHGRVDAGRDRNDPGEHERQQRQDHREDQPLTDELGIRTLVLEREAEIALRQVLHPFEVLDPDRAVEPVFAPERLDLLGADRAAGRRERRDVGREEIARRRLDDREHGHREEEEQRWQEHQPLQDVSGHRRHIFARSLDGP